MHAILKRQLKQAMAGAESAPTPEAWSSLLDGLERAFRQVDQDRYLVERSLALSSEEMQELHAQLAAERDAVRAVVQSLAEGVCALDHDGVLTQINPEAARLLGLDGASAIGQKLSSLVTAKDASGRGLEQIVTPPFVTESEPRLLLSAHPGLFVTYAVRPLPGERPGTLLTLRDISERKRLEAEREAMNNRLLDLSRRAGMAEIAAGVLHNVGNAMNSVNVSAAVASETVRKSRLPGLSKAAAVLLEHRERLGEFLEGPGRELPAYLRALAEELTGEHQRVLNEIESLSRSIEHIRRIVDTQQELARVTPARELVTCAELIDESMKVVSGTLERHGIDVEVDVEDSAGVLVDKHQVIQILVNFLTNAKHALMSRARGERRIRIRSGRARSGHLEISVTDNGDGIAAENMPRLFSYGFTTRKDGHGFGLHSAALAAKVMGGAVRVCSEGTGRGAEFTLEIPGTAQEARERSNAPGL